MIRCVCIYVGLVNKLFIFDCIFGIFATDLGILHVL